MWLSVGYAGARLECSSRAFCVVGRWVAGRRVRGLRCCARTGRLPVAGTARSSTSGGARRSSPSPRRTGVCAGPLYGVVRGARTRCAVRGQPRAADRPGRAWTSWAVDAGRPSARPIALSDWPPRRMSAFNCRSPGPTPRRTLPSSPQNPRSPQLPEIQGVAGIAKTR